MTKVQEIHLSAHNWDWGVVQEERLPFPWERPPFFLTITHSLSRLSLSSKWYYLLNIISCQSLESIGRKTIILSLVSNRVSPYQQQQAMSRKMFQLNHPLSPPILPPPQFYIIIRQDNSNQSLLPRTLHPCPRTTEILSQPRNPFTLRQRSHRFSTP